MKANELMIDDWVMDTEPTYAWYYDEVANRYHINITQGHRTGVSGNFIFVHELQHALRLCGLNELADNFKLKLIEE